MSTKEVTAIGIKLLAIWLLVHVVLYIPSLSMTFSGLQSYNQEQLPMNLYFAMVGSSIFIGVLAAYLLFRISNSVLGSLPSTTETDTTAISQQFLLQLAGVFFIVSALGSLPGILMAAGKVATIQMASYFYLLGTLLELSAGLYMLIKPKVWLLWFNKLRGRA